MTRPLIPNVLAINVNPVIPIRTKAVSGMNPDL